MRTNLKKQIESKFKTQSEFAEALGVDKSTVSMWISGERTPSTNMLSKIYEVLDSEFDPLEILKNE